MSQDYNDHEIESQACLAVFVILATIVAAVVVGAILYLTRFT